MSNKRKLSGSEWKRDKAKKALVRSAGSGHSSILQFLSVADKAPNSSADVLNQSVTPSVQTNTAD